MHQEPHFQDELEAWIEDNHDQLAAAAAAMGRTTDELAADIRAVSSGKVERELRRFGIDPSEVFEHPPGCPCCTWAEPREPYVAPDEPGRNDPCHCGSGQKYKRCCLRSES